MFVLNEGATNFHSAKKDKLITLIPWITLLVIVRESPDKNLHYDALAPTHLWLQHDKFLSHCLQFLQFCITP